jgi:hypothetical protein
MTTAPTAEQPATFHLFDPRRRIATIGKQGVSENGPAFYPITDAHCFYACHGCMIEQHDVVPVLRAYAPKQADDGWPTHPWWQRQVALLLPVDDFEWVAQRSYESWWIHDVPDLNRHIVTLTDSLTHPTVERVVPLLPFAA